MYYILEGRKPKAATAAEWAVWWNTSPNRFIKQTVIEKVGRVSTVFLGMGFHKNQLFETMIRDGLYPDFQERYETWEQAVERHDEICRLLKNNLSPNIEEESPDKETEARRERLALNLDLIEIDRITNE